MFVTSLKKIMKYFKKQFILIFLFFNVHNSNIITKYFYNNYQQTFLFSHAKNYIYFLFLIKSIRIPYIKFILSESFCLMVCFWIIFYLGFLPLTLVNCNIPKNSSRKIELNAKLIKKAVPKFK